VKVLRYGARRLAGKMLRRSSLRGRGAAARWVQRHPGPDVRYRDKLGLLRTSDLRITLEAYWFFGLGGLPDAVHATVPPGSWAVDVGANTGVMTGQLCRAVGRRGLVWAIEPLPLNVSRLDQLRSANDLPQLQVFDCALAGTDGRASLRTAGPTGGAYASLTASWIDEGRVDVATRTLDGLVAEHEHRLAGRRLAFLKIDAEGAELEILDGAAETLARHRPVVFCEFNDVVLRDAGRSSAELLQRFRSLGYDPAPGWSAAAGRLEGAVVDILLVSASTR
jgi:FkbM family methyltransferase